MVETDLQQINGVSEEKIIIKQSQQGNANAFSEIVKRHQDRLYNTIYRLVNAPDEALDICQEVFLKAFQNIKYFRGDSSLFTYLYCIAFNECVAYRHKRQRIKNNMEQRAKSIGDCEQDMSSLNLQTKERDEYIQDALNSLEPELKEVIILKDIEGFSYEEVSKTLKISVSTVRTNLEKARQLLRLKLKDLL
ncbi:MAG: sigma-70 family RNA polymerase sigma factor [Planctomycetota bacterium]